MEHDGIKFWCYNAGHVLGAAMFMLEIAGVHVLYTGDYSMEDDRHLMAAEVPSISPDVLIVESTYGVQVHSPREDREARFTQTVAKTVRYIVACVNGGSFSCLNASSMHCLQERRALSHSRVRTGPRTGVAFDP
jgi:hypothetical protein